MQYHLAQRIFIYGTNMFAYRVGNVPPCCWCGQHARLLIMDVCAYVSYYNARGLFVCLFLIQISAAARCAAKRAMPAEGHMECVLRGPACNYLLCGRRTCGVFLSRGTETPFLINIMWSPVTGRNPL